MSNMESLIIRLKQEIAMENYAMVTEFKNTECEVEIIYIKETAKEFLKLEE